jgi:hypothetical protein
MQEATYRQAKPRYLQNSGRRNRLPHLALQTVGKLPGACGVLVGQAVSPAREAA